MGKDVMLKFFTSDNFVMLTASFLFTYISLLNTKEPLNFLSFCCDKLDHPLKNTINLILHFVVVCVFVKALSGMVLSDSGKSFYEIPEWKILIFTATVTVIIFKGKSIKEVL